jgi:hypothetical protein
MTRLASAVLRLRLRPAQSQANRIKPPVFDWPLLLADDELKAHRFATAARPCPIFLKGFAVLLLIALKASQSEVV